MDYVYAVCGNTVIDSGAPGYFALCICQSEKAANQYLAYFSNRCGQLQHDEHEAFIDTPYEFGYVESYPRRFWIEKIPLADSLSFLDMKKYYESNIRGIKRQQLKKETSETQVPESENPFTLKGNDLFMLFKENERLQKNGRKQTVNLQQNAGVASSNTTF